MAEEFVDLYEILELPVDADRNTLRKRVNELYLDAQRNLDHRHFATKIKFQELFEVTLPRARYILLDDGRRDEYDRVVRAFRASKGGGLPAPVESPGAVSPSIAPAPGAEDVQLQRTEASAQTPASTERAPVIEPLPEAISDPAQVERERQELWNKWKVGLETALGAEGEKPKARGATTSAPTSFSMPATPGEAPNASVAPATPAPASRPTNVPKAARAKVQVSFETDETRAEVSNLNAPEAAGPKAGEPGISPAEIEARRAQHRRQLVEEVLVNVGLIWGIVGAALVVVPGLIALIAASGHYYPRGAAPLLGFPSTVLWGGGWLVMGISAFFVSRGLSNSMRHKKETELSLLSHEELLKKIGKL